MARDYYHAVVKKALEMDGWTITDDPYFIYVGRRKGFIDLGAERKLIGAQKGDEKIAIEIKSFLAPSDLDQFEDALGQFMVYLVALERKEPERRLFLALPRGFYERFFDDPFFSELTQRYSVNMIVFEEEQPKITQWIKY